MSELKDKKLGDVLRFGNGKSRPKTIGEYPIYGGNGILGYTDQTNYENETIVIGRVGAYCGSVYFEDKPIWVSDNALAAKPKDNNDAFYLYYFLKNLDLNQFALGSSHPLMTQTLLNSIDIEICDDPDEQKAIAAVLSSLDDKIDLLHRQNKTLEALAETLFRQWFIEEAKKDWESGILDDILEVKGGTTPSTKVREYWDGDIHWTAPRDLSNNEHIFLFETARRITQKGLAKISSGVLPVGTILLSSRAPIGYLAITEIPVAINQGYIAILAKKGFLNHFIYFWVKTNMDYIVANANGSVFLEITKSTFRKLEIQIPPEELRVEFDQQVGPIFNKLKCNSLQIRTLEKLRDTLLPKLMSGEVRVKIGPQMGADEQIAQMEK